MKAISTSLAQFARRHPVFSLLVFLTILWILFVQLYNSISLDGGHVRISTAQESFKDIATARTAGEIRDAAHFSTLSAEVYGKPKSGGEIVLDWELKNCPKDKILKQWTWVPLPADLSKEPKGATRGKARWDSDLVIGLWKRNEFLPDGKTRAPKQVALVFRGTAKVGDFWSNFRWFTRWLGQGWDQYDLTRTVVPEIEDYVAKTYGADTEIIAAGHSLGGGLAHQAAYASNRINRVYSFNGSSVTGFYSVDKAWRNERKKALRIFRLHEKGEILNLLRGFMQLIYPVSETNPKIVNITYNFGIGSLIKQHSIEVLSCALIHNYK